jgi:hypothetical protein
MTKPSEGLAPGSGSVTPVQRLNVREGSLRFQSLHFSLSPFRRVDAHGSAPRALSSPAVIGTYRQTMNRWEMRALRLVKYSAGENVIPGDTHCEVDRSCLSDYSTCIVPQFSTERSAATNGTASAVSL